jgi:hypothetical protein
LDIEFLGKRKRAGSAITSNSDLKDPIEISFVVSGVTSGEILQKVGSEGWVIVKEDAVVNPQDEPEDGGGRSIDEEASVNVGGFETVRTQGRRE